MAHKLIFVCAHVTCCT